MKIDMTTDDWKKLYNIMVAVNKCNYFTSEEQIFARAFTDSFFTDIWAQPRRSHE